MYEGMGFITSTIKTNQTNKSLKPAWDIKGDLVSNAHVNGIYGILIAGNRDFMDF